MRMEQYFDRPDSCYFVPDPEWAASYSRENWEKEVKHILRVADDDRFHRRPLHLFRCLGLLGRGRDR